MVITPSRLGQFILLQPSWAEVMIIMHETDRGWGHKLLVKMNLHEAPARNLMGSMIFNLLSEAPQGALSWACDMSFLRGFQLLLLQQGMMTLIRDLNTVLLKTEGLRCSG